ncbi:ras oncogene family 4 protein, putative [Ichthyophthirius multifiliis]|uniref:Ras oncogene family 4 protein, putative n=1 Tax=Ichthyophthirius multifiliis TaxID=5932 RepID=G0R2D7_ICHMU|nr:ras oncogene family 4 protein, putative [Ichthyophthirius multifiliis]EGR28373.1 ras oncogene family 4 protein, putative [Ichthyophthirius multifiliis]|eukprot:XP_004027718.1 ras oncogene family 4 protein, putative [Ichthyophthirius multifiliis]
MKKVKAKVVVAGSPACGKTSLLQMYTSNGQNFLKDYNMTQGAEVSSKIVTFEEQDKDVELFFFDISGQECYVSITKELLGNSDLCVLVYDCTDVESFNSVSKWAEQIKKANQNKLPPGILVSTKNDMRGAITIEIGQGKDLAQKLGLQYFEVSAARNIDIDQPFYLLAKKMI